MALMAPRRIVVAVLLAVSLIAGAGVAAFLPDAVDRDDQLATIHEYEQRIAETGGELAALENARRCGCLVFTRHAASGARSREKLLRSTARSTGSTEH